MRFGGTAADHGHCRWDEKGYLFGFNVLGFRVSGARSGSEPGYKRCSGFVARSLQEANAEHALARFSGV